MDILSALLLGVVQGLTEFLPVSSSGHLVLIGNLLRFNEPGVLFEVTLHAGTTLAIVYFFWQDILRISKREIYLIILGTVPAVLVGLVFKNFIEGLFASSLVVGFTLLATGAMNIITDTKKGEREKLSFADALFVGVAQAIAIVPGISRSGSTIFMARSRGIDAAKAARFSFLLSVPAIVGANMLEIMGNGLRVETPVLYVVGFISAFISGAVAIKLVINMLSQKKFKLFGVYCIIVGVATILLLSPLQ